MKDQRKGKRTVLEDCESVRRRSGHTRKRGIRRKEACRRGLNGKHVKAEAVERSEKSD